MNKRVFITSAQVVSAAGLSLSTFFSSLVQGKSGIKALSRIDTADLATKIGGEVPLKTLAGPPELLGHALSPVVDTKAWLAWNAIAPMLKEIPAAAAFFCAVGLERVDIPVLQQASFETTPVCPEIPPTILPHALWKAAEKEGPVFMQVSACAASTIAIGMAFHAVRRGLLPSAVAGGVDSMLFPYGIHAFNSLGALSERNDLGAAALAPFDVKRSGTVLGEGAAFLLIESEQSMVAEKHHPLAEILGFGSSMDAFHPVMPEPDGIGLVASMKQAMSDARILPEQVDYVNAHGTGTTQNDLMEAKALHRVFGSRAPSLPMSSTKPFHGHLLTAAGAIETIACLLGFVHNTLPPTLHLHTLDPECRIDAVPNRARAAHPTIILKNSSGFGGQNASLILARPN